jgi:hypothetical protein
MCKQSGVIRKCQTTSSILRIYHFISSADSPMPQLWPGHSHNTSTAIGRKCISTRDTGGRYPTHVGARACSKLQPRVTRELEERGNTPATCIQDCMACNSLTTRITRLHGHVLTVCNGKCGCPATQTCRGRSHTAGIHENTERPPAARAVGHRDPAAIGARACSAAVSRGLRQTRPTNVGRESTNNGSSLQQRVARECASGGTSKRKWRQTSHLAWCGGELTGEAVIGGSGGSLICPTVWTPLFTSNDNRIPAPQGKVSRRVCTLDFAL